MSTREEIQRQRRDLRPDDLDDVIGIAARLQEEARGKTSVDAVKDVARELDVDPEYVDAAIAELERQRADEARSKAEAERSAIAAHEQRRRSLRRAGTVLALLAALAGIVTTGAATIGAAHVNAAAEQVTLAESRLDVVLDRQESMAPQLIALAGGELDNIGELEAKARAATNLDARLAVASQLGVEMASAFGDLPPPSDDASSQMRMNLQYELVGAQNRITTEQRRYEEARSAWRSAATTPSGRVSIALGLADAPPAR